MRPDKISIKNYKCFDESGCIIQIYKPINIIIGKNNTGKSSLIEAIRFLTNGDQKFFENKRNGKSPEIVCEHSFNKDLIGESFPSDVSGGELLINHKQYGQGFDKSTLLYNIGPNLSMKFLSIDKEFKSSATKYFNGYVQQLDSPLRNKIFSHLSAERDILPESPNSAISLSTTGIGATNLVQSIINRDVYNSDLIEELLLKELNKIVNPDIEFTRILVQENQNHVWEIYLENTIDGRIPLSKMGSGIKTILLVLILLHIKPAIDKRDINEYVFALEELENNLHPSLQRRLYYYLFEFSRQRNCILFLTTHSNIVIDLYNSLENTQIFHISRHEGLTNLTSILKQNELKRILDDLEVKASDILQSNGIIWVEGPSDRTYLKKWISLFDKTLIEGYHYSIMFYGGRLLSNLTFDYEVIKNDLIPLLKLNANSFVLMDRDGKSISQKLNETKIRIQNEIGHDNVWVTKGREIENYLANNTIENWLYKTYKITSKFDNEINSKFEDNILKVDKANKIKYGLNKNKFASEIISYIIVDECKRLDLSQKIDVLVKTIRKWNKT